MVERVEAEIGRVLMPWHRFWRTRFLEPDGGVKDQDIGADQRLDTVKNGAMAHQTGGPAEQQEWFDPVAGLAARRVPVLDAAGPDTVAPQHGGVFGRQMPPRRQKALLAV